jgi:hypothetical protein
MRNLATPALILTFTTLSGCISWTNKPEKSPSERAAEQLECRVNELYGIPCQEKPLPETRVSETRENAGGWTNASGAFFSNIQSKGTCRGNVPVIDNIAIADAPKCEVSYTNRVHIPVVCYPSGNDDFRTTPYAFKSIHWEIENQRGIASTDSSGKLSVSYQASRMLKEPIPTSDPEVIKPLILMVRDQRFEVRPPFAQREVELPRHFCE